MVSQLFYQRYQLILHDIPNVELEDVGETVVSTIKWSKCVRVYWLYFEVNM